MTNAKQYITKDEEGYELYIALENETCAGVAVESISMFLGAVDDGEGLFFRKNFIDVTVDRAIRVVLHVHDAVGGLGQGCVRRILAVVDARNILDGLGRDQDGEVVLAHGDQFGQLGDNGFVLGVLLAVCAEQAGNLAEDIADE